MRFSHGLIAGVWALIVQAVPIGQAQAQTSPVVVELYSSQGCPVCPPADELLADLSQRDDVIALALHVDYWDYMGWQDSFAQHAFTERQKTYAHGWGRNSIYTPQMVIGGTFAIEGFRGMKIMSEIMRQRDTPGIVVVQLEQRSGDTLAVRAESSVPLGNEADVQLVRYRPRIEVSISGGENAGREAVYHNVVTSWRIIAKWDGRAPLALEVEAPGPEEAVVIVQQGGQGSILASARQR